jgi:hypothetical protein
MRTSTWMLAALAILAGCSFEPGALRPPGDRDGAPPPGPDAPPAVPIDAAPPDAARDGDGDTVLDPDDNCPADPNTDQADCDGDGVGDVCDPGSEGPDEDGDRVADACDNCPSKANPEQANTRDEDEVGDDCDPRPDDDGDTIEYFEGFATDSNEPPPGWIEATGPELDDTTWVVAGGALISEPTEGPVILYLSDVPLPADVAIETRASSQGVLLEINAVASGGVVSRYTNGESSDAGLFCVLEQRLDESSPAGVRIRDFASGASPVQQAPWRAEVGDVFTTLHVRYGIGGGSTTLCRATPADTQFEPVQVSAVDLVGPENGQVGLRAVRSRRAVEYILVYGLGGPLPP